MTTRSAILSYIIRYKSEHDGNSPTVRQIAGGVGVKSTSTVVYHLDRLEIAGKIKRDALGAICVPGGQWELQA